MPDSTLDARVEEASAKADTQGPNVHLLRGKDRNTITAALSHNWLTAFATALLASERSARAEVEKELADAKRDFAEKFIALAAKNDALRSQVASAKVEGARKALTKLYDEMMTFESPHFLLGNNRSHVVPIEVAEFRDRHYPATPPERVSEDVPFPIALRVEQGHVFVTRDDAKRLLALAGGAE